MSNFIKIQSVGTQMIHAQRRKDGRKGRHDEANSCFSQFCERAYEYINTSRDSLIISNNTWSDTMMIPGFSMT